MQTQEGPGQPWQLGCPWSRPCGPHAPLPAGRLPLAPGAGGAGLHRAAGLQPEGAAGLHAAAEPAVPHRGALRAAGWGTASEKVSHAGATV